MVYASIWFRLIWISDIAHATYIAEIWTKMRLDFIVIRISSIPILEVHCTVICLDFR